MMKLGLYLENNHSTTLNIDRVQSPGSSAVYYINFASLFTVDFFSQNNFFLHYNDCTGHTITRSHHEKNSCA